MGNARAGSVSTSTVQTRCARDYACLRARNTRRAPTRIAIEDSGR